MNVMNWLEEWYKSKCDGEWEHSCGVKINTLDNPGWFVKIDLVDTDLENKRFETVEIDNSDNDWMVCRVNSNIFEGFGNTSKLQGILEVFKDWVIS